MWCYRRLGEGSLSLISQLPFKEQSLIQENGMGRWEGEIWPMEGKSPRANLSCPCKTNILTHRSHTFHKNCMLSAGRDQVLQNILLDLAQWVHLSSLGMPLFYGSKWENYSFKSLQLFFLASNFYFKFISSSFSEIFWKYKGKTKKIKKINSG